MAEPMSRAQAAPEPDWVSVHAFHHADLDGMLVSAVGPLVEGMCREGLVTNWFFLRYWEGGNHLRLRVRPAPGATTAVRARITTALAAHLRTHPSPDILDEATYRVMAGTFATWEQRGPVDTALQPNNSIAFVPYRPEHDRYGQGPSLTAVERHFAESSAFALDIVRQVPDPRRRVPACFPLLLLAWLTARPDPAALATWTTGLYDAWAGRFDEALSSPGTPPDLDERYAQRRGPLIESAVALQSNATARVCPDDPRASARWLRSVRALRDDLAALAAAGRFRPAPRPGWERLEQDADPLDRVLPVLDVCAHLLCNRLGLTSTQECSVRFLAARAVADLTESGS